VLHHVLSALSPAAREAGVEIASDLEGVSEGRARIWGSRDELIQVFANLVENAIRYGAIGKRIEVSAARAVASGIDSVQVTVRELRTRHCGQAYSTAHRTVLSRRCRNQQDKKRYRFGTCDRQAHHDPAWRTSFCRFGRGRRRGLHCHNSGLGRELVWKYPIIIQHIQQVRASQNCSEVVIKAGPPR
jgi:hypothetical protein